MFFIFPERIVIFTRFIISYVMDKGRIISGLAIMAGLIVLGIMLPRSVGKFREYDRVVNVKGLCEREVKADKVIWPVVYKVMANDVQAIYDQIDAGNEIILNFLESGGISPSEITVSVPQISDKLANEYGDNKLCQPYLEKLNFSDGYELALCVGLGYADENPEAKPRDMGKVAFVE